MAKVHGLEDLRALIRRLESVRASAIPKVRDAIGSAYVKLVGDEFRESRDPYNRAWAPVVRNRKRDRAAKARRAARGLPARADKPLIDTGRLRASVSFLPHGRDGIRIILPVEYASYHQEGTKNEDGTRRIQRRQILPDAKDGGLPPKWWMVANREAAKVVADHFEGKK